jgi:hypothetical protein
MKVRGTINRWIGNLTPVLMNQNKLKCRQEVAFDASQPSRAISHNLELKIVACHAEPVWSVAVPPTCQTIMPPIDTTISYAHSVDCWGSCAGLARHCQVSTCLDSRSIEAPSRWVTALDRPQHALMMRLRPSWCLEVIELSISPD